MKYIVYQTLNKVNNKIYIGVHQTENPEIFDGYYGCGITISNQSKLKHPKVPIAFAIKKYGFKNFVRTTIKVFDTMDEALKLEAELVDTNFIKRTDTYNVTLGGGIPPRNDITVYQYSLDGTFIAEFPSIEKASKSIGIKSSTLSQALKNNSVSGGFYWANKRYNKLNVSLYKTPQCKKLYLYDIDGNFVKEMNSFSEFCRAYNSSTAHIERALQRGTRVRGYFLSLQKVDKLDTSYSYIRAYGKVFQYDLTGKLLATFASVKDAVKALGINETNLNSAARQCKPYKNCLWSRGDFPITVKSCYPIASKMKKVGVYTLDNKLVEVLKSVKAARAKYGSSVVHVLKGTQRQTRGYIFRYL